MTGKIAINARTRAAKFYILGASSLFWVKIPKFMTLNSRVGIAILKSAEFGILKIVMIKWALLKGPILL